MLSEKVGNTSSDAQDEIFNELLKKKTHLNFPAVWFTYIIFICAVGAVSKIKCPNMSKTETTVTRDVLFFPYMTISKRL